MHRSALLSVLLVVGFATSASAQLYSTTSQVSINARKAESISLVVTNGLTSGTAATPVVISEGSANPFGGNITLTPTWDLAATAASVQIGGYISAPLAFGTNVISNDYIQARTSGLGALSAYTPFNGTVAGIGGAANALIVFDAAATGADRKVTGTEKQFTLALQLNIPSTVEVVPGDYSGTITFVARSQ